MIFTRRDLIRYGTLGALASILPAQRIFLDRSSVSADPLSCAANRIFTGDIVIPEGFIVPADEIWMFDPNVSTTVTIANNVVVEGTLQMLPANAGVIHTLRFEGVNEDAFIGGHTMVPIASDVGLWITGNGLLDAQGTPRAGWNRAGDDPTWLTTDELIAAPYKPGDTFGFTPFTKGGVVPTTVGPNGVTYPTEIANLTRNVRIEGTPEHRAHIMFVGCQRPQTLKYLAIRYMGPTKDPGTGFDVNVVGRYSLHFHMCGAATQGSLVEGVLVRDGGGAAFVPHMSDGITFRDCVTYDIRDAGFWWDDNTATNDVVFDHCAAMLIRAMPTYRGYATRGFVHGEGLNMTAINCVAVGVQGNNVNAGAFAWPATANQNNNVWIVHDNIAHNNRGPGISVWQNDSNPHVLERLTSYHNTVGISHGAYSNSYTYRDIVTFKNASELDQHALGSATFDRIQFHGTSKIQKHTLTPAGVLRYLDCLFTGLITVQEAYDKGTKGGIIRFESTSPVTDLTPAKFNVASIFSTITVHNSDGTMFQVVKP